jgi:hypothetical protein
VPRDSERARTKAAAIADLMDGTQPAVVAARYGLNAATVRSWKARLDVPVATPVATGVATVIQPSVETQQLEIGALIMENLRAKLIATQRIAEYATTQDWLNKQTAADVAALFEALDRSATNILDRLAQRGSTDADQ